VLVSNGFEFVPAGVPVTWWSPLGTEDHEGGTLPLGLLLDDRHEFKAIPRLFAAGPSTSLIVSPCHIEQVMAAWTGCWSSRSGQGQPDAALGQPVKE
jgi:hypothetical protein